MRRKMSINESDENGDLVGNFDFLHQHDIDRAQILRLARNLQSNQCDKLAKYRTINNGMSRTSSYSCQSKRTLI